jgi:hypothetical protein
MCNSTEYSSYLQAGDPDSSAKTLGELAQSPCAHIRRRVAENAATPLAIAIDLLRDTAVEVRIALTENEQILPLLAPDLARDKSSDVRFALAENHSTPRPVLEYLLADENPYVAARAARTLNRSARALLYAA